MPKGVYERKPFTLETREKMSKRMKGNTIRLGHKLTKEQKERKSKAHKGKTLREQNGQWKGGKSIKGGYVVVLQPGGKYQKESRSVMEKYLERPLTKEEVVHHINEDILDNRIENLRLFKNKSEHTTYHHKLRGYKTKE